MHLIIIYMLICAKEILNIIIKDLRQIYQLQTTLQATLQRNGESILIITGM